MGKQRGFKPQGSINPIPKIKPTGPTMIERLQRETRPTWEQLRKRLKIKHNTSSETLERWENENYLSELQAIRKEKRDTQEAQDLKELKKRSHSTSLKSSKKKNKKTSPTQSASCSKSEKSKSNSSHPFKLSSFFEMTAKKDNQHIRN